MHAILIIFFLMTNNWHKDTRDRLSFIGGANGENMNWNSIPWCFGLETWSEELNENNEINIHTQIKRHEMPQLHLFFVLFFLLCGIESVLIWLVVFAMLVADRGRTWHNMQIDEAIEKRIQSHYVSYLSEEI